MTFRVVPPLRYRKTWDKSMEGIASQLQKQSQRPLAAEGAAGASLAGRR